MPTTANLPVTLLIEVHGCYDGVQGDAYAWQHLTVQPSAFGIRKPVADPFANSTWTGHLMCSAPQEASEYLIPLYSAMSILKLKRFGNR